MRTHRIASLVAFCFVACFALQLRRADAAPPPQYQVTALGAVDNVVASPGDINNARQIVGTMFPPTGQTFAPGGTNRAYRTNDAVIDRVADNLGLPTSLQTSGGNSVAARINNVGQTLAWAIPLNPGGSIAPWKSYVVAPGQTMATATNLGAAGGTHNYGRSINDLGQVAGEVGFSGDQPWHAYLYTPGGSPLKDLGSLGGPYSSAYSVNNSGQVTGSAENAARFSRAFRTAPNAVIQPADDLGSLGGKYANGRVINDAGQVAGMSSNVTETASRLFRTAPNADINPATDDLGTLPGGTYIEPEDMNATGDIVGWGNRTGSSQHAFVVLGSTLYDVNDLISPSLGITLEVASGINDQGDIVARGFINGGDGRDRAFLLTPVPEPASSSLVITFVCVAVGIRPNRRQRPA
jgi:probable HAF family extracellular repeat protein